VLIADELTPSVVAQLDWTRIKGFATDAGSRTYHTAILARSLGVPAVVGLHDVSRRVPPGASVIIDGETGDVVIDPTPALWQEAEGRSSSRRITVLTHEEDGPLQTSDGEPIVLHANIERYPFAIEELVYRTVQEALSNVRKHARASKVTIALQKRNGSLTGWVRDDGRGFDLERALDRRRMRMHVGLDAMRERVHLAGGRLDIRSETAAGTSVEFAVPLPAPRSSRG